MEEKHSGQASAELQGGAGAHAGLCRLLKLTLLRGLTTWNRRADQGFAAGPLVLLAGRDE
jgi:hypothetical protein